MSGTVRIVYLQEPDGMWLGYVEDYPDYMTQGETFEDLQEHLKDLFYDISGGHIPQVRTRMEMAV